VTGDGSPRPLDPEAEVERLIESLSRGRSDALPRGAIPPADDAALEPARAEARAEAERAGRGDALSRAQRLMAEWTLERYRHEGFDAAYLTGWLDSPERRMDVVDLMVDAATAVALADLLADDTRATLMTRFDALHDGAPTD
jgi:hypothetical protein